MRKRLAVLIFGFFVQGVIAQNNFVPVRFGIRAGLNYSNMNFSKGSPPPEIPVETAWGQGFSAGFLMIVPFAKDFFIQPEYLYSQLGGEAKNMDTTFQLHYLSLPVLFRWEPIGKFSLLAGPQFALLIDARQEVGDISSILTYDMENRSLGVTFGMEYEILKSFALAARFMHGLNHIGLAQQIKVEEFKFEVLQFSVVYIF